MERASAKGPALISSECIIAGYRIDSISSRFSVLNTPISTTAPIDTKTHVWPINGGIAQWLTNQRSLWAISRQKHDTFCDCLPVTKSIGVNNYMCVIDTHMIVVRVVPSIQNSCIKYSTQTNILLKCSLTLTILIIIWISIILLFQFNWDLLTTDHTSLLDHGTLHLQCKNWLVFSGQQFQWSVKWWPLVNWLTNDHWVTDHWPLYQTFECWPLTAPYSWDH
jgi:hypothetical protein